MVKAWHYLKSKIKQIIQPKVPDNFARTLYLGFLSKSWQWKELSSLGQVIADWQCVGYRRCVKLYIKGYKKYTKMYYEALNSWEMWETILKK